MKIQLAHFVDLAKCCKMSIWLQKSVLIQPRTSLGKSDVSHAVDAAAAREYQCEVGLLTRTTKIQGNAQSEPTDTTEHRFLQLNIHFAAFCEIYKIFILLHRSEFNFSKNAL